MRNTIALLLLTATLFTGCGTAATSAPAKQAADNNQQDVTTTTEKNDETAEATPVTTPTTTGPIPVQVQFVGMSADITFEVEIASIFSKSAPITSGDSVAALDAQGVLHQVVDLIMPTAGEFFITFRLGGLPACKPVGMYKNLTASLAIQVDPWAICPEIKPVQMTDSSVSVHFETAVAQADYPFEITVYARPFEASDAYASGQSRLVTTPQGIVQAVDLVVPFYGEFLVVSQHNGNMKCADGRTDEAVGQYLTFAGPETSVAFSLNLEDCYRVMSDGTPAFGIVKVWGVYGDDDGDQDNGFTSFSSATVVVTHVATGKTFVDTCCTEADQVRFDLVPSGLIRLEVLQAGYLPFVRDYILEEGNILELGLEIMLQLDQSKGQIYFQTDYPFYAAVGSNFSLTKMLSVSYWPACCNKPFDDTNAYLTEVHTTDSNVVMLTEEGVAFVVGGGNASIEVTDNFGRRATLYIEAFYQP